MTNHPFPAVRHTAVRLECIVRMVRAGSAIVLTPESSDCLMHAHKRLAAATRFDAEGFATGQRNGRAYDAERVADAMSRNLFAAADNVEAAANAEPDRKCRHYISMIEGEIRAAATDVLLAAGLIEE